MTVYLQPFCDFTGGKYRTQVPFVFDGHEYATDGRICVRMKTEKPNSVPPKAEKGDKQLIFPKADQLGWIHDEVKSSVWQPWPFPAYERLGSVFDEDGFNARDFSNPLDSMAYMKLESPRIGRSGPKRQSICISLRYDILVRAYLPNPTFVCDEKDGRVLIRFDGGEAILMEYRVNQEI